MFGGFKGTPKPFVGFPYCKTNISPSASLHETWENIGTCLFGNLATSMIPVEVELGNGEILATHFFRERLFTHQTYGKGFVPRKCSSGRRENPLTSKDLAIVDLSSPSE